MSTVLFVDDQEEILVLIKRMLKNEPYEMLFANSGEEALGMVEENSVDVVVTDVIMPNMSGLELLDTLRESHPKIVRIILSGFSQIPTLLSAINHGKIYRYITKPWQVDEEAREIIRDAVAYGALLKSDGPTISIDDFCDYMAEKDESFLLVKEDEIIGLHKSLRGDYEIGQVYSPQETKSNLSKAYPIGKDLTVYWVE